MKKVLFVATIDEHILAFHTPYLKWFKEQGVEVHVASNGNFNIPYADIKYNIPFSRLPFKLDNLKSYNKLKKIINSNSYNLIHCHTPVGGVLTRIAAIRSRKRKTKVLYTAHGFHFFKGAPLKNWLLYYPIEKWLSKHTDILITINEEDYKLAKNNFKTKSIKLVNGVGIDLNKFISQTIERKQELRKKYGYKPDDFILIFAGELNYGKHQDLLINGVNLLKNKMPNIKLLLAGMGPLYEQYKKQINDLNINDYIKLLGFRKDINNLMMLSDIAVSSSRREGLPVNVMEGMATGLPLIVTDCRGNSDLVNDGENGFIIGINNTTQFKNKVNELFQSESLRNKFGKRSLELIKYYSLENILNDMKEIYYEQFS